MNTKTIKFPEELSNVDFRETAINYIAGELTATLFTAERKWINKITNYATKYPNEVTITDTNDDGSICATVPTKWFKLSPPRQVSEEQRQAASERFRAMHKANKTESKG